ncbi:hypothetical protein [Flammeovirga sp. SJP92]|uniref:hypothetical protein n=1 Tax=Flammeovirga sp. SJP92 TaxID=1775430 RepID=UPI0012FB165D|nr:hypothetical protein [Flammeovirga sp. SJP92]
MSTRRTTTQTITKAIIIALNLNGNEITKNWTWNYATLQFTTGFSGGTAGRHIGQPLRDGYIYNGDQ